MFKYIISLFFIIFIIKTKSCLTDSDCGNSPYIQCKTKSSIVDGVGNVDYFHYKNNLEIDKENQRLLFTIKYDDEEIEQRIISIPLTGLKDNKKDVICHATLYPMGHNKIKGLINYVPKSKSMVIATVKTGITLNSGGNEKDTFYLPKLLTVNNTYSSVGFSGEKFVFSEDENTQYSCVYGGGVYKSEFGNPKSIESKERLFFGNDLYGGCAAIRLGEKTSTILTHPKQKKQILQQEGQNQKLEKQQEHEPQEKEKQELELEQNEIEHLQVQQPKPLPKQQLLYILYVKNKKREIYHNSIHIGNLSNIQPGGETLIKNLPVLYKDEENGISHFEYSEIENLLIYSNSLGIFKVDLSIKRNSKKPIPKLIYKFNVTPSFKYYNGYIYLSTNEKIIRISIKNNKPETLFTFNSDKNNNNKNNKKTSKALYQAGHCICAPGFSNNGTNQCNYCEKSTHIISKDKNTLRCIPLKLDSNPMVCFHSQDCPLSKTCVLNKFSKYGQCLNK
ncbi:hypothetical protein RB653_007905 [Dictyostelium firmibasis]|uniref:Uncharacterized protein n=1 Tax=Dictyostelium firmibasis TaxID=79012 RepID=A0AAN7TVD7_9MYCE